MSDPLPACGNPNCSGCPHQITDQPPPQPSDSPPIADLVIDDIHARKQVGIQRYGVALQAGNGRDAMVDAYQEAMDLTLYLRQVLAERADDAEPVTRPAESDTQPLADRDPHPDTPPHASGILGRRWLDGDGEFWHSKAGAEFRDSRPVREVLLVDPAAAHVIETSLALRVAERAVDRYGSGTEVVWGRFQDANAAHSAAVDALTGGQPRDAWQRRSIGGPDHDGLTGRPLALLKTSCPYEWETANDDGPHECGEPAGHTEDHVCPCGAHRMPLDEPAPESAHTHACARTDEHHTHECGCGYEWQADRWYEDGEACGAETDPEPAGDGPGWDRVTIDRIIADAHSGGVPPEYMLTPEDAGQVEALLADHVRVAAERLREHNRAERAEHERDAARAELAEVTAERDRVQRERLALRDEQERIRVLLDQVAIDVGGEHGVTILMQQYEKRRAELGAVRRAHDSAQQTITQQGKQVAQANADLAVAREELEQLRAMKCFACGKQIGHINHVGNLFGWGCADGKTCRPSRDEELATARRDTAADGVAYAARCIRFDVQTMVPIAELADRLDQRAAEIRTGQRDTPGTEEEVTGDAT